MLDIGVFINDEKLISTDEGISELKKQGVNKIGLPWELLISCEGHENLGFKEMSNRLNESEIEIYTVTVPKGWGNELYSIVNQNSEQRLALISRMQKLIRIAGEAGAKIVPVYTSGACLPYCEERYTESALDFIGELIPYAKAMGLKLALVNSYYSQGGISNRVSEQVSQHSRLFIDSTQRLLDIVTEINSPNVGLCLDTGVSNIKGTVLEDMHMLKNYIIHFNLSDTIKKQKDMLQPGYGTVPWVVLGRVINDMNYTLPLFVCAPPFNGADFSMVISETRALLDGDVYTRPDGGIIGKDPVNGRIIIRE